MALGVETLYPLESDLFERLVAFRRDRHRHPELSWKEERTANRIEEAVRRLGLEPRRMGGTGVVAEIEGRRRGPIVALRADTDALPVKEETGLPFSSTNVGVMHACGHDGHSAMLLGAAELLLRNGPPPLPVRLIWQPAEETGAGAPALVRAGVLEDVGVIFGGHLDRHFLPGTVIVTDGVVNAAADEFLVEIQGQGGHGARPHEALDAVVVGSLFVTALQTIVSREVNPADPSVVSVGQFTAGTAHNVIAGHARLAGTIRCQSQQNRERLHEAVTRIAHAVGQLHGARIQVEIRPGTPPLINHPRATSVARKAAHQVVGEERVLAMEIANMGGEDFAYYLEHRPGCSVRFGSQVEGREGFPAHSTGRHRSCPRS